MRTTTTTPANLYAALTAAALIVVRCSGRPAVIVESDETTGRTPKQHVPAEHSVIEVSPGETAVLQCPSNDEHHRFQFWWMKPDQIIGPGTELNSDKFRYEVLTGTLYIKVRTLRRRVERDKNSVNDRLH